jgi:alkaline phosphatase D
MKYMLLCCLAACLLACNPKNADLVYQPQSLERQTTLQTIAFGSCNRQSSPQDMWRDVIANDPDLWIWLGDNIYGDSEDMDVLEAKYQMQKSNQLYTQLRKTTPVVGIWDDHDYGVNDGDKTYAKKDESKELMLNFLDVPPDAPVRQRRGAYQAYTFGPVGRQVKVILLDARYFRDELEKGTGGQRYKPNPAGDILGDAQWAWLEEELTDSQAQLHLIGCGIQMIPEEHPFEKWANFPAARQRLFDVLQKTKPAKAILLSGDRHIAEISKMELPLLDYPLYDVTSSGMTHAYTGAGEEPNRHRVGALIKQKNFGILRIDWAGSRPTVTAEIRGLGNGLLLERTLR